MSTRSIAGNGVRLSPRGWIVVAIAAAALIAATAVLVIEDQTAPSATEALAKASEAVEWRPVEARLCSFPYRPYAGITRGTAAVRLDDLSPIYRAAGGTIEEARRHPTVANLHALGVAYLLLQNDALAIATLDAALRREGADDDIHRAIEHSIDAPLLIDVAAAHLVQRPEMRVADLLMAFEASDRATRFERYRNTALFDRALALEKLTLHDDAAAAWRDYLRRDTASSWSKDARLALARTEPTKSRWERDAISLAPLILPDDALHDSGRARSYAEEELLPEWARSVLAGDTRSAATALRKAVAVGSLLARVSSDSTVADETARILGAGSLQRLARAQVAYAAARKTYRGSPSEAARESLLAVADQFDEAGSPLGFRARMFAASALQYAGRNSEALAETTALLGKIGAKTSRYPSIAGQLHWVAGLASTTLGELEQAQDHYRASRKAFTTIDDLASLSGVAAATAECLTYLGYEDEVWQQILESADLSTRYASAQRRYLAFAQSTTFATERHYFGVARYFEGRMRAAARDSGDPAIECSALLIAAESEQNRGDTTETLRTLDAAERIAPLITAAGIRNHLLLRMALQRATELRQQQQPLAALANLSSAERLAHNLEYVVFRPEIHLLRSEAYYALHRRDAAIGEVQQGLEAYRKIAPESDAMDRATYARLGRRLADQQIAYSLGSNEQTAWNAVLAAHDNWIPERQRSTSAAEALIVYHVLDDQLLIWVVRGIQRHLVRQAIASPVLQARVDELVHATRDAATVDAVRPAAERAFDLLIRPIVPYLTGARRLVILTDSMIDAVPFAVLAERESRRLLIEEWELSLIGGSGGAANSRLPAQQLDRATLFVAAAPLVSALPALSGARDEGERIAMEWPRSTLVTGSAATPHAFLEGALSHEIVHFAGHVTHPFDPALAALRLASDGQGDGRLTAATLTMISRHPPALVVLSACSAAAGRHTALGPLSIARQLLAGGVPSVIASLWDIDDASTSSLMVSFYRDLRNGQPPAEALRNAQLDAIRDHVAPGSWAVFQSYVNQRTI
jgi:CHAT domain-containing protein